ncbi:MAG: hypothetical protein OXE03_01705 [Gammaproteobacteria bacterium]|nr:hypothetical protein [Gammaproteobacteria bacterium]
MDKQTIHLITLIIAIIGSNAWSHANLSGRIGAVEDRLSVRISEVENSLSDRIAALETRVDNIDKRLVIVETSLKANNQYIASFLGQRLLRADIPGE